MTHKPLKMTHKWAKMTHKWGMFSQILFILEKNYLTNFSGSYEKKLSILNLILGTRFNTFNEFLYSQNINLNLLINKFIK